MGIQFTSQEAELKHLNVRKEGPEDMPVTAIDLKINCDTDGYCASSLMGTDDTPEFWHDNEDRDVIYHGIDMIKSWAQFENHEVKFAGVKFSSARLKNFSFRPLAGRQVNLTFSASITEPTDRQINILVEMVRETSHCEVVAPPDLFEGQRDE